MKAISFSHYELFEVGVIEEVSAEFVYRHFSLQSKVKTLWFRHGCQDVTPLALWMDTTILVPTERLRFLNTNAGITKAHFDGHFSD